MKIVANKQTADLAFDKTIECKIVSVEKKASGIYMVQSDEAKFEAYVSNSNTYYVNDIVYVTIPGGDYTRQKFIVGRKTDENDASSVYNLKFPFDDFIKLKQIELFGINGSELLRLQTEFREEAKKITSNTELSAEEKAQQLAELTEKYNQAENALREVNDVTTGFLANNPVDHNVLLYEVNFGDAPIVGMTKLGIETEVQTLLGNFHPVSGSYGLQIDVTGIVGASETVEAYELTVPYLFINSDMYGNSYAYFQPYIQQKVLDISTFQQISAVSVRFVQDGNFYDENGIIIPYQEYNEDEELKYLPDNIFLTNTKMYFGMAGSEMDEEKLYLYTYDPLYYATNNASYDEKTLRFQWVHIKDDKSGTLLFNKPEDIDNFNNALRKEIFGENNDNPTAEQITAYNNRKLELYWYIEDMADVTDTDILSSALGKLYAGNRWKVITDNIELGKQTGYFYDSGFKDLCADKSSDAVFEYKINFKNLAGNGEYKYSRCKYKVAIMFGQNEYVSPELTFKNFDAIDGAVNEGQTENADMIFRCFSGRRDKSGKYSIEWDNKSAIGRFYVYDENDTVLMDTDGRRFSDINYYLQLWRRDPNDPQNYIPLMYEKYDTTDYFEDGVNKYEANTNFTAKWHFFNKDTMISGREEENLDDEELRAFAELLGMPEVKDKEVTYEDENGTHTDWIMDPNDPDIKALKAITRKFTIREKLFAQYKNNDVTAVVTQGGTKYYAHKDFQFGRASSQGSEYTASIVIVEGDGLPGADSYLVAGKTFKLKCQVYDFNGKEANLEDKDVEYEWILLNEDKCYISNVHKEDQYYIGTWNFSHTVNGESVQNAAPAFKVIVKGAYDYDIYAKRGFLMGVESPDTESSPPYYAIVPDRIEYRADGLKPYYYENYFTVYQVGTDQQIYCNWQFAENISSGKYPSIFIVNKDVPAKTVNQGNKPEDEEIISEAHKDWRLQVDEKTYWWDNDYDNGVIQLDGIGKSPYKMRQAIVFDQNVYPSSLVNTWDGVSLSLDTKTGSILANRIATGTKDRSGRFTGVMMGDWKPYGDETFDIEGIYGFQDGQETFGFLKNGSGFIGAAGTGRINFDGRSAMISGAEVNDDGNPTCYINLNPARLKDNGINSVSNSDSQYFLYCETNRMSSADEDLDLAWANAFFKKVPLKTADGKIVKDADGNPQMVENTKDYFIVDPSRGVLTTGGVIARYGYIGDWIIDKGGLSWYSKLGLTKEKFYDTIYLGNQERNPYTIINKGNDIHISIPATYKKDENGNPLKDDKGELIVDTEAKYYEYLISAGRTTKNSFSNENTGSMNFGVTADGYLFSQSGRIGGWIIGIDTLQSADGSIIFNGTEGSATFGKFIENKGELVGTITLAGYQVDGLSQVSEKVNTNSADVIEQLLNNNGMSSYDFTIDIIQNSGEASINGKIEQNIDHYIIRSIDQAYSCNSYNIGDLIELKTAITKNTVTFKSKEEMLEQCSTKVGMVVNNKIQRQYIWTRSSVVLDIYASKEATTPIATLTLSTDPYCIGERPNNCEEVRTDTEVETSAVGTYWYYAIKDITEKYATIDLITNLTPSSINVWKAWSELTLDNLTLKEEKVACDYYWNILYNSTENIAFSTRGFAVFIHNTNQDDENADQNTVSGNVPPSIAFDIQVANSSKQWQLTSNQWRVYQKYILNDINYNLGIMLDIGRSNSIIEGENTTVTIPIILENFTPISTLSERTLLNLECSLGTQEKPWNNIYASDGIYLRSYDPSTTKYNYDLVATQKWVSEVISQPLWARLTAVNNLAEKAYRVANGAASKAQSAASTAQAAADAAKAAANKAISSINISYSAGASRTLVLQMRTVGGSTITSNSVWIGEMYSALLKLLKALQDQYKAHTHSVTVSAKSTGSHSHDYTIGMGYTASSTLGVTASGETGKP